MSHFVICPYCNQRFDRDKQTAISVGSRRYAHEECYKRKQEALTKEEKDKIALEKYIGEHITNNGSVTPKVQRQIRQYIKDYNYTYSGMLKALVYFYEIQGNSYDKAKGGIGIIPYVYSDAYNYYFAIWLANNNNSNLNIENYSTKRETIKIHSPKRKLKKKKIFSFLEMEGEEYE